MNNKQYKTSVQTSLNDVNFLVWKRFFENVSYVQRKLQSIVQGTQKYPLYLRFKPIFE